MKMSKEIMDKLRDAFDDQGEEQSDVFVTIKNFYKQLEEGDVVTAADILESLGFERESASDIKFKPSNKASKPKKSTKPLYKTYEDLAYISAMESTRCHMLIDKLRATIELLDAQQQYYEAISAIERDNESFGFDLDI